MKCSDFDKIDTKKILKLKRKITQIPVGGGYLVKAIKLLRIRKYQKLCYRNNSFIGISSDIPTDFNLITFPHGISGIYISGKAKIGNNCTIFHQVTIGSNTLTDSKHYGAPTIGNNVYIGAGAKIIGNVNIGDDVRIGANAVIVNDIPSNSTVVVSPNRIIAHHNKRDNTFKSIDNLKNDK